MTTAAHRWATIGLGTALGAAALVGCDKTNSTTATPANSGTGATGLGEGKQVTGPLADRVGPDSGEGIGGAPTYGEATGTGFPTGDAAHAGGQGSGLAGFGGTGAKGTSFAISDAHDSHPDAAIAKAPPQWVLPEQ